MIVLPLPPSVNSYHRSVPLKTGGNKVLISREGRKWKKKALQLAQMQWRGGPLKGDVCVTIHVYFRNRRRDLGNVEKPLGDLLQAAGVIVNDRQTAEIHLYRYFDSGNPRVELVVSPLPSTEQTDA